MTTALFLVLFVAIRFVLTIAWIGTFFIATRYHLPVEWLLHYLNGSGKTKVVPEWAWKQAHKAMEYAWNTRDKTWLWDEDGEDVTGEDWDAQVGKSILVGHSTLYDGSGFAERPTMFYLIGCFWYTVDSVLGMEPTKSCDSAWVYCHGVDTYDWHPNNQGFYFGSPLGGSQIILKVVSFLGRVFGKEYFYVQEDDYLNGDGSATAYVSNKLWAEAVKYGAKPFDTAYSGWFKGETRYDYGYEEEEYEYEDEYYEDEYENEYEYEEED